MCNPLTSIVLAPGEIRTGYPTSTAATCPNIKPRRFADGRPCATSYCVCGLLLVIEMSTSTLIKNARIFDGETVVTERGYILLDDGLIKEIGEMGASPLPAADIIVDAPGHTIVPGLIDAHVHVHGGTDELAQALNFGVTTVLDLFNEPDHVAELKAESSVRADIAEIKSACHAATVKGGWPGPVIIATAADKEKVGWQIACEIAQVNRYRRWSKLEHGPRCLHQIKRKPMWWT